MDDKGITANAQVEPPIPSEEDVSNDKKVVVANTVSNPGCRVDVAPNGSERDVSETLSEQFEADNAVSDAFVRRCECVGMASYAVHDWALLHRSPETAMLFFFAPHFFNLGILLTMVTGVDFRRFHITIPMCIARRFHNVSLYLYISLVAIAAVAAFLEPPAEKVPFNNSVVSMGLIVVAAYSIAFTLKTGLCEGELPSQPRKTMFKPLAQAGVHTLRVMDALTDLSFMQVLLQERKEGCWWFNKPGRCEGNTVKIVVLVICAIADLLVSAYMVLLGSEDLSARKKGLILKLHIAALVFELGVVFVTLLSFISAAHRPEDERDPAAVENQGSQMAVICVSLATTFLTFTLTMLGAGSAFKGLKHVTGRISTVVQSHVRSMTGGS